jgi:RHS repeat-associated protein
VKKVFGAIALFILCCTVTFGQVPQSVIPAQPMENRGLYSIDLQDLSVVVNVPVRSKPGFSATFSGRLNQINDVYNPTLIESQISPVEVNLLSGGSVNGLLGGNAVLRSGHVSEVLCPNGTTETFEFSQWYFTDANGTVHPLPPADYIDTETQLGGGASCYQSSFSDQTTDYFAEVHVATSPSNNHVNVWTNNGSYLTNTLTLPTATNYFYTTGFTSYTDKHGNVTSTNSTFTSYTDVMAGIAPLTSTGLTSAPTFSWTDINSGTQETKIDTGSYYRKTSYGCSAENAYDITDTSPVTLMTGVTFPDSSMTMSYEPNGSGYTTGRLGEITLPAGGTVSFAYSGFNCNYLQTTQMTVTTADGTWTYAWAPVTYSGSTTTYGSVTTVTDPAGNKKIYSFVGLPQYYTGNNFANITGVQTQVISAANPAVSERTELTCYNGNTTSCLSTVPTPPLTQVDSYVTLLGMGALHTTKTLDKYGNALSRKSYDYNGTTYALYQATYNTGTGCGASTYITGLICTSQVSYNSGTKVMGTTNTYNTNGDLLTTNSYMPGNTTLTFTNTFNTNGTLATSKTPSGVTTSYMYGDCNGFGLTQITTNSLSAYKTYGATGCDGGVPITATDTNGNVTHFGYANISTGVADPYYRLMSSTDPQTNVVSHYYHPTWREDAFPLVSVTTEFDGYGRTLRTQKLQSPSSTTYDTTSYTYHQSTTGGLGATRTSSVPCASANNVDCTTGITTTQFDNMGRPSTVTDGGGGVKTFTYSYNDVETTASPAPSGENSKSVLAQTNGFGMNTIWCQIVTSTLPAGSSCGANATGSGYPTTNALTTGTGTFTTTTTLGAQTTTKVFDALGRITSETYPESGTTTYYYDSQSSSCTATNGRLTEKKDAKANVLCYVYDSYGRLAQVSANGSSCHNYFYDNSAGFSGSIPTGITVSNPLGHMVEAATSNCSTTLITDEWFSYDSLGRRTDAWELTPHSLVNGTHVYYHVNEAYFPNGEPNVETFTGIDANNTVVTYGVDGEGRWTSAAIGSASEITSVTYNAAQQPLVMSFPTGEVSTTTSAAIAAHATTFTVTSATDIVINQMLNVDTNTGPTMQEQVQVQSIAGNIVTIGGSGFRHSHNSGVAVVSQVGDNDSYTYTPSTGRMYSYKIVSDESGGSLSGLLSWNANGTVAALETTDGINTAGTQTCAFVYDDLGRIASDLCGTGSSSYRSTMTYDQYGNITKASSNGTAPVWPQSGSYSATTNRLSSSTYDSNGSTLTDYFHTYQWDGFNRVSTMDSNTMTYDALGEVVEVANGSAYTVFEYTPIGSKIIWNGLNTWTRGHLPMPGGTSLDWTPAATYIHHKDWLGSSRITTAAGAVYTDKAFGAYGEDTAQDFGPATNFNYAGDSQDIATAVYDTPNREYMPYQSRWPNVDPSHHGWNGYAFSGNPLATIDPSGLYDVAPDDGPDGGADSTADIALDGIISGDITDWDFVEELDQSIIQQADSLAVNASPTPVDTIASEVTQQYLGGYTSYFQGTDASNGAPVFGAVVYAPTLLGPTASQNSSNPVGSSVPAYDWGPTYPPSIFTPVNNMPIVSQWRPRKSTDYVKGPPTPYKPTLTDCVTGPNDAVERMNENNAPAEHDPNAAGATVVYQNGNRGNYVANSPEVGEQMNALTVFFAGIINALGCVLNAF